MLRNIRTVMVARSAVMGRGIAKSIAGGGFETTVLDRAPESIVDLPNGANAMSTNWPASWKSPARTV